MGEQRRCKRSKCRYIFVFNILYFDFLPALAMLTFVSHANKDRQTDRQTDRQLDQTLINKGYEII